MRLSLFIMSWALVAWGQPAWISWLAPLAAIGGYTLFWQSLPSESSPRRRFWLGSAWFGAVQLVQLSWMASLEFQGFYILFLYLFLSTALGAQFGLITRLLPRSIEIRRIFGLAGLWVVLEWSRLFIWSGFTFNPIGLALTSSLMTLQLASLVGVFGLSFWVLFVNLLGYRAWQKPYRFRCWMGWLVAAIAPYAFGAAVLALHEQHIATQPEKTLSALVVQTALSPAQKQPLPGREEEALHPLIQWQRILRILGQHREEYIELIVLPESAVPYGVHTAIAPLDMTLARLEKLAPGEMTKVLPPFEAPYVYEVVTPDGPILAATNAFWAQTLANYFEADLIIGLEDASDAGLYTISAFHFRPYKPLEGRYDKRVLLPIAESLPFDWCRPIARWYGIQEGYTAGEKAVVFQGTLPMGISICYEETFGHLMRDNRLQGAEVLVNVTNDGWYPHSRLPQQHFYLSRLRAVENGIPMVRACNTGVSGGIDSLGRPVELFGGGQPSAEWRAGAIQLDLPLYSRATLYTLWGDMPILVLAFCALLFAAPLPKWARFRQREVLSIDP